MGVAKSRRVLGVECLERREVMVATFVPIEGTLNLGHAYGELVKSNQSLYAGGGDENQRGLLKTDGTAAGTVKLIDERTQRLVPFNGGVLFVTTSSNASRLWKSDGTVAGTVPLGDFNSSMPNSFTVVGGTAYFTAGSGASGRSLWKTDGTVAGTVLVKSPVGTSSWSSVESLVPRGNDLCFVSHVDYNKRELWVSDGTAAGTIKVRDFNSWRYDFPVETQVFNGRLYYMETIIPQVGLRNYELWSTDGTIAGTRKELSLSPTRDPASHQFAPFNGALYLFSSESGIYRIPGDGTAITKISNVLTEGGLPVEYNGEVWVRGHNTLLRLKSDGTIKSDAKGASYSSPLAEIEGKLIFYVPFRGSYYYGVSDGTQFGFAFYTSLNSRIIELNGEHYAVAKSTRGDIAISRYQDNIAPHLAYSGDFKVRAGGAVPFNSAGYRITDSDDSGDFRSLVVTSPPKHGQFVLRSADLKPITELPASYTSSSSSESLYIYRHFGDGSLEDSFEVSARDASGALSPPVTVPIRITGISPTQAVFVPGDDGKLQFKIIDTVASGNANQIVMRTYIDPGLREEYFEISDQSGTPIITNQAFGKGVGGNDTHAIRIPVSHFRDVSKITIALGGGNDSFFYAPLENSLLAETKIDVDLGAGTDLVLANDLNTALNRWRITEAYGGSVRLADRYEFKFHNTEQVAGDSSPDLFEIYSKLPAGMFLDGRAAGSDRIEAFCDGDLRLTDTNLRLSNPITTRNFTINSIESVTLYGDSKANVIDASLFSGSTALYGYGGNDLLRGGKGNDRIYGGLGADVILGNDGDDFLYGEADRDLLIGGRGADELYGGDGEDILLAATTVHDRNDASLQAILAAWNTGESYEKRIEKITKTGVGPNRVRLAAISVANDGYRDRLVGGLDRDWFFAEISIASNAIDATDVGYETINDL